MSSRQTLACLRNEPRRVKVLSLVQEPIKTKIQIQTKIQRLFFSSAQEQNQVRYLGERATQQSASE